MMNFNPRSHERSDIVLDGDMDMDTVISIHAPTRGATTIGCGIISPSLISIHAPTRGATHISQG